jgi:hypothetical protein
MVVTKRGKEAALADVYRYRGMSPGSFPRVPDGRALTPVPPWFLIPHNNVPNLKRIEISAGVIYETMGVCSQQSRHKAVTQEATRCVSTVRIEAETDNAFAVAHYVCDDRQSAHRHLTEVDVGIANVRF